MTLSPLLAILKPQKMQKDHRERNQKTRLTRTNAAFLQKSWKWPCWKLTRRTAMRSFESYRHELTRYLSWFSLELRTTASPTESTPMATGRRKLRFWTWKNKKKLLILPNSQTAKQPTLWQRGQSMFHTFLDPTLSFWNAFAGGISAQQRKATPCHLWFTSIQSTRSSSGLHARHLHVVVVKSSTLALGLALLELHCLLENMSIEIQTSDLHFRLC